MGLACDYRVMAEGFRIGMVEIEAVSSVKMISAQHSSNNGKN